MKVCPVCGSLVRTLVQVSAEQDEAGYWHLATENTRFNQAEIDASCEAPGNPCICTNSHCGIPRIDDDTLINPATYGLCVYSYVPAWITYSNKLPSEKEALMAKYNTRESLPDGLREEYDRWYARLVWHPWVGTMSEAKDL